MIPFLSRSLAATALAFILFTPALAAPSCSVVRIGSGSEPSGLNNAGQVVGNRYLADGSALAEIWSQGSTSPLAPAWSGSSEAWGINDAGVAAGAVTWTATDGSTVTRAATFAAGAATLLAPPGTLSSWADGINNAGQIALSVQMADGSWRAQLYSPDSGYADLGTLGTWADPHGLNQNGVVVGTSAVSEAEWHAFMYANGTIQDLGTPDASSGANAINSQGVVVGYANPAPGDEFEHAVMFAGGQAIDLGTLGGLRSSAFDINDNGDILGWSFRADGSLGYFLYSNGAMVDLDTLLDPGTHLTGATSINDDGQILASATDGDTSFNVLLTPTGAPMASRALAAPEPASRDTLQLAPRSGKAYPEGRRRRQMVRQPG